MVVRVDKTMKGFWEKESVVEERGGMEEVERKCEEMLEKYRKEEEERKAVADEVRQPEIKNVQERRGNEEEEEVREEKSAAAEPKTMK